MSRDQPGWGRGGRGCSSLCSGKGHSRRAECSKEGAVVFQAMNFPWGILPRKVPEEVPALSTAQAQFEVPGYHTVFSVFG